MTNSTTQSWPYWRRALSGHGLVGLDFNADQASALAAEIRAVLKAADGFYPRLDDLAYRLEFDADYLRISR
jgi:hypothetical protein